jgi:hypothetical protein
MKVTYPSIPTLGFELGVFLYQVNPDMTIDQLARAMRSFVQTFHIAIDLNQNAMHEVIEERLAYNVGMGYEHAQRPSRNE